MKAARPMTKSTKHTIIMLSLFFNSLDSSRRMGGASGVVGRAISYLSNFSCIGKYMTALRRAESMIFLRNISRQAWKRYSPFVGAFRGGGSDLSEIGSPS